MGAAVMESTKLDKAVVKRKILALAAKMSSIKISEKVSELLRTWQRNKAKLIPSEDVELEMRCWAELWLSRHTHRRD